MNITVSDLYFMLEKAFPLTLAESFDNCGLLFGRRDRPVSSVLVSLDITLPVVSEAINLGVDLIVSHHPLFFGGVKKLTDENEQGRCALALAEHQIAAVCMHTNADSAEGGVNDLLAVRLGLSQIGPLGGGESGGLGRVGTLAQALPFGRYVPFVRETLAAKGLRYVDAGRDVFRVAVGGGACGDLIPLAAAAGADTFVTADVKYHQFQQAYALRLNLIDAGHYATENPICEAFCQKISEAFPGLSVSVSKANTELPLYFAP